MKVRPVLISVFIAAIFLGIYDYNLSGNWKNSLTFWKDAISKNSQNYYAWCGLADTYRLDGNFEEALKAYDISVRQNPKEDLSVNNRGMLKIAMRDYPGAVRDLSESIKLKSNKFKLSKNSLSDSNNLAGAYVNRGNANLFLKKYLAAQRDYDSAISINNMDPVTFANRSVTKIVLNDYIRAEMDINSALKLDPNNPIAIYNRGLILIKSKDSLMAMAEFQKANNISPGIYNFYKELGISEYVFNPADISGIPSDESVAIIVNKAVAKAQNNDFKGALADLDKAIAMEPKNGIIWDNRANVKVSLKDFNGAIADFSKALELNPNDAEAYLNRGNSKFKINDKTACDDWRKARDLGHLMANDMLIKYCN